MIVKVVFYIADVAYFLYYYLTCLYHLLKILDYLIEFDVEVNL